MKEINNEDYLDLLLQEFSFLFSIYKFPTLYVHLLLFAGFKLQIQFESLHAVVTRPAAKIWRARADIRNGHVQKICGLCCCRCGVSGLRL